MASRNGAGASGIGVHKPPEQSDPELDALVREIIGRVAGFLWSWVWAEQHRQAIEQARARFRKAQVSK